MERERSYLYTPSIFYTVSNLEIEFIGTTNFKVGDIVKLIMLLIQI
jgi:hypothetical protein